MSAFWPPLFLYRDCAGEVRLGRPSLEDEYVSPTMLYCTDSDPWWFYAERRGWSSTAGAAGLRSDPLVQDVLDLAPRVRTEDDAYGFERLVVDDPNDMMFLKLRLG